MANQSVWYFTGLPNDIIKNIESDLHTHYGNQMKDSRLLGDELNKVKNFFNKVVIIKSDNKVKQNYLRLLCSEIN